VRQSEHIDTSDPLRDQLQRPLRELRMSVIDRYSEERWLPGHDREKVEMYRMGG
jgi:hypothetical protein